MDKKQKITKGIYLCKQQTRVEDSSRSFLRINAKKFKQWKHKAFLAGIMQATHRMTCGVDEMLMFNGAKIFSYAPSLTSEYCEIF